MKSSTFSSSSSFALMLAGLIVLAAGPHDMAATTSSAQYSTTGRDLFGEQVSSKLQIHIPQNLNKPSGYDHLEALFGNPPYGESITQNLYYADSDLCDATNTSAGYPIRPMDDQGKMLPWPSPFILMVDRGGCTFVHKVRTAQRVGAVGVIIADNTCLCSAGDECVISDPNMDCELREPIMADDGSGDDVSIPSFLMFKQDADLVKAEVMANNVVTMEMQWSVPPSLDDHVEFELWTTPVDENSKEFQKEFEEAVVALGDRAYFTPQMYIYDGIRSGCRGADGENSCYNLCTNYGRYCATDPDNDLDTGISGADVVEESLRRMCIWNLYGMNDGIGVHWWDYVNEFMLRCDTEEDFSDNQCINDAMEHSNVDTGKIDQCMADSGGLEEDVENFLLEAQLLAKDTSSVVILPTMLVNGVSINGSLDFPTVFKAICAGYASGANPSVCTMCDDCPNQKSCIANGYCGTSQTTEAPIASIKPESNISITTVMEESEEIDNGIYDDAIGVTTAAASEANIDTSKNPEESTISSATTAPVATTTSTATAPAASSKAGKLSPSSSAHSILVPMVSSKSSKEGDGSKISIMIWSKSAKVHTFMSIPTSSILSKSAKAQTKLSTDISMSIPASSSPKSKSTKFAKGATLPYSKSGKSVKQHQEHQQHNQPFKPKADKYSSESKYDVENSSKSMKSSSSSSTASSLSSPSISSSPLSPKSAKSVFFAKSQKSNSSNEVTLNNDITTAAAGSQDHNGAKTDKHRLFRNRKQVVSTRNVVLHH